jgi:hypothetical protein
MSISGMVPHDSAHRPTRLRFDRRRVGGGGALAGQATMGSEDLLGQIFGRFCIGK